MTDKGVNMFVFFAEILGRPLRTPGGLELGRLCDIKVRLGELFPKAATAVLRPRRRARPVGLDWSGIERLDEDAIIVRAGAEDRLRPLEVGAEEILLREDLLDKQVVDTHGAKVERVNDIHFLAINGDLRIVHVDFGFRGLLRRLGWMRAVDRVTDWLFAYRLPDKWVSWKFVQPLTSDPRHNLKLNVTLRSLHAIHPSDLADLLEEMDRDNRSSVFQLLDTETAAETLQEVDPDLQLQLIEAAPAEKASDILEEMEPDEAADFLAELPEEKQQSLMDTMEEPARQTVEELMKFEEGTAGSIMTADYIAVPRGATIGRAVEAFRGVVHPLETLAYIYVVDEDERPVGVLTLRHLLTCDPAEAVAGIMNPNLVKVETDDDIDSVAAVFLKYKFISVPVVDAGGVLQGIITLQDVMQARSGD